jgi:hypothetical protein
MKLLIINNFSNNSFRKWISVISSKLWFSKNTDVITYTDNISNTNITITEYYDIIIVYTLDYLHVDTKNVVIFLGVTSQTVTPGVNEIVYYEDLIHFLDLNLIQSPNLIFSLTPEFINFNKLNNKKSVKCNSLAVFLNLMDIKSLTNLFIFLNKLTNTNVYIYEYDEKNLGDIINLKNNNIMIQNYNNFDKYLFEISKNDYAIVSCNNWAAVCVILNIPFLSYDINYMNYNNLNRYIISDDLSTAYNMLTADTNIKNQLHDIYNVNHYIWKNIFNSNWYTQKISDNVCINDTDITLKLIRRCGFKIYKFNEYEYKLYIHNKIVYGNYTKCWNYILWFHKFIAAIKCTKLNFINFENTSDLCLLNHISGINTYKIDGSIHSDSEWIGYCDSEINIKTFIFNNLDNFNNCYGIYTSDTKIYNILWNYLQLHQIFDVSLETINFNVVDIINSNIYKYL